MQKVRLGKTQMMVTKVGLGGIPLQRISDEQAVALIRYGVEKGINWIDTANGYGVSEERFGKALKVFERDRVNIFTKGGGRTPEQLDEQLSLSLQRLQTDYLDLYQLHCVPAGADWDQMVQEGVLDFLREKKGQGIIRHIGATAHLRQAMHKMFEYEDIEVVQWPFNLLMQEEGEDILERCEAHDVGFIAMKPFAGGELEDARLVMRFLNQYDTVAPNPGFEKIAEMDEVLGVASQTEPLSAAEWQEIQNLRQELGKRFCHRCHYCSPCPQGVDIVTLMVMGSMLRRMPLARVEECLGQAVRSFDKCVACGACERKCPFQLPIRERIKLGAALFRQTVEA